MLKIILFSLLLYTGLLGEEHTILLENENSFFFYKDKDEYKANFVKFVTRWNELLPDLPLYSNIYHDFFNEKLKNYDTNNLIRISDALLYAHIEDK